MIQENWKEQVQRDNIKEAKDIIIIKAKIRWIGGSKMKKHRDTNNR